MASLILIPTQKQADYRFFVSTQTGLISDDLFQLV